MFQFFVSFNKTSFVTTKLSILVPIQEKFHRNSNAVFSIQRQISLTFAKVPLWVQIPIYTQKLKGFRLKLDRKIIYM